MADKISNLFVEVVVAPGFSSGAIDILSQKPSLRLIELPDFFDRESSFVLKHIQGGMLLQQPDHLVFDSNNLTVVTQKKPSNLESRDLKFAFAIAKHVKSNAIVLVKDGQTVGIGAGQMSRVEAVEISLKKANEKSKGAVCASDAFFPFKDSVEYLSAHGITSIIQPGGSKRDDESIAMCDEMGVSMVMTGIRHFKH